MQLKKRGSLRSSLALLSAGLLAANVGGASAVRAQTFSDAPDAGNGTDNYDPFSQLDGGLLFYQEKGGRVRAVEPQASFTAHGSNGQTLSFGLVVDSVTGATPNGAVPSDLPQDFVTPIKVTGSTTTMTTASGGSKIIQLPPTPGQIAQAALGRQYTVPANTLPVDKGFHDKRYAGTIGWTTPLGSTLDVFGVSLGYSSEYDYSAFTGNARIAKDFNSHNTTLSLAVNFEDDTSSPYGGVPTPLTSMNAQWKSPASRGRTQTDIVGGLTEVLSRRWLLQLNYSYGISNGYQNDPYRIISVVDPVSGEPVNSLYEGRPNTRNRQSVYIDNKFDFGPAITDLSFRYYTDSWGIRSETAELSNRFAITNALYIEPNVRWYSQTAANFYHYYLVDGAPTPQYASSDWRLGKFTGLTYGAKLGLKLSDNAELYLRGQYYKQSGTSHPADAIGQLQNQKSL